MTLPIDSAERKRIPMYTGLRVYFPDALAAVAAHSFINNEKHNPGEPCHWSREKSSDHMDCIDRHLTDIAARRNDLDFKVAELKAIAWRALAELQLSLEAQEARNAEALDRAAVIANLTADRFAIVEKFDNQICEQFIGHRAGEIGACDCPLCIQEALVLKGRPA